MDHSIEMASRYSHLNQDDVREQLLEKVYHIEELTEKEKDEIKKLKRDFADTINLIIAGERAKTPKERGRILLGLKEITEKLEQSS